MDTYIYQGTELLIENDDGYKYDDTFNTNIYSSLFEGSPLSDYLEFPLSDSISIGTNNICDFDIDGDQITCWNNPSPIDDTNDSGKTLQIDQRKRLLESNTSSAEQYAAVPLKSSQSIFIANSTFQSDSEGNIKKLKIGPQIISENESKKRTNSRTIILPDDDYENLIKRFKYSSTVNTLPNKLPQLLNIDNATHESIPHGISSLKSSQKISPKPFDSTSKTTFNNIDERYLKKQQRMIRNRESACLSRKKKKDYVVSLETKISELSKENSCLRVENNSLRTRLTQIAQNLNCNCSKTIKVAKKKNVVYLLAVMCIFMLNFGPFEQLFSSESMMDKEISPGSIPIYQKRGLLWADESAEFSNLHNLSSTINGENSKPVLYPTCPIYLNQSENIRLVRELRRWIGDVPEYFNLSSILRTNDVSRENPIFKLKFSLSESNSYGYEKRTKRKGPKSRSTLGNKIQYTNLEKRTNLNLGTSNIDPYNKKKLQIFNPYYSNAMKYAEFFDEINRQDDTFYVVSFNGDHNMLIPALAHNKTVRPKMSLMLPSIGLNGTKSFDDGHVTLMKIECEVVNTSLIQVKEETIPQHFRNNINYNATGESSPLNSAPKRRNLGNT